MENKVKATGTPLRIQEDMQRERLEFIGNLCDAMDEFWKSFASKYPQVKSGDLAPQETLRFEEACRAAAEAWIMANVPSNL